MKRFGIQTKHYPDGDLYQAFGPSTVGGLCEDYDEACGQLLDIYKVSGSLTDEENEDAISLYESVHDI